MKLRYLPFLPLCLSVPSVVAQITDLPKRTENTVFRDRVKPNWLPDGASFWYRVQTAPQDHEFVLINARTGERKTAPELKSLGLPESEPVKSSGRKIESRKTSRTGESSGILFVNTLDTTVDVFWINQEGESIPYGSVPAKEEREQHTYEGHVWVIKTPAGDTLAVIEAGATIETILIDGKGITSEKEAPKTAERGVISPDGKWSAFVEKGVVMLRNISEKAEVPLKVNLAAGSSFRGNPSWAPDSSAFVLSAAVEVPTRQVTLVDSSPKDQLQPKLKTFGYAKPGDPLPKPDLVIFRPGEEGQVVDRTLFNEPFTQSPRIEGLWSSDGSEYFFDYNERGHQRYCILAVNAKTGKTRVVVEETNKTFIDYTQKTWRHWLPDSGELLWMSERSGWCHLYLYDIKSGTLKNPVTAGNWPVREVLHVDEKAREIWFLASGLKSSEDPYHLHLCRVNFDGTGFRQLTEGDGNHRIEFSPTREFFIDAWSRVDHPPVHELRRSADGTLVSDLERADISALIATGWTIPERFVTKGRDGKTDIHGILIKPSHFDPAKKYPVLENIYAGPHSAFAPKDFGRLLELHEFAEQGFIVVKMDGMGTNHRGKAFHDFAWKDLKDAGFPDRIAWVKSAATTRPWMDLTHVGIYGGSAGGQSAMRALLDHSDFYQVAVADCGCHDNRMDKIWWNEQWMGWPVDESYAKSSNAGDAAKLKGHLLLIVGELDNNVDPASTTQVVAALQKAGKSFDFMPIVGSGHGAAETPFGSKRRMEFLKKHLLPQRAQRGTENREGGAK